MRRVEVEHEVVELHPRDAVDPGEEVGEGIGGLVHREIEVEAEAALSEGRRAADVDAREGEGRLLRGEDLAGELEDRAEVF